MRAIVVAVVLSTIAGAATSAATLSDAKVGFSADRLLVVNGKPYQGKMWNMPGKERHEQNLNGIPAAFVLRNDTPIGDLVLPKLHTTVEFVMPPELRLFADPRLVRKPVGHETVNGIATTKYDVEVTVPEGHGNGNLWLSDDEHPDEARRHLHPGERQGCDVALGTDQRASRAATWIAVRAACRGSRSSRPRRSRHCWA